MNQKEFEFNTEHVSGQKSNDNKMFTISSKQYEVELYKKAVQDICDKITRLEQDKTFLNRMIGRLENEIKSLKL